MEGPVRGFRARLFVLVCLIIALLSAGPPEAKGQGGIIQKMGEAAASVYNSAAGASFTISKIEPKNSEHIVRIFFTDSCDMETLRRDLKFIPPVPLEWYNSNFSRETNMLTLRGQFKPGQRYVLVLPPQFKSAYGRIYARGVAGFTMPDRDAEIAFYDQGSVIERNSRQMLHVQLMNVNEVLVKGIRIPPALLPLAARQVQGVFRTDWNVPQAGQTIGDDELGAALPQAAARIKTALGSDGDFRDLLGDVFEEDQLFFNQQEQNLFHQFSIPLTFRREKEKGGLELVRVVSKQAERTVRTSFRLFRITDVGLTYKLSDDALLVWATSLYSGKPLKDVAFFGFTANEEVVPLGTGDSRGLLYVGNNAARKRASLRRGGEGQINSRPLLLNEITMIAAITRDDVTYVNIASEGNVKPVGVEQGKSPRMSAASPRAEVKAPAKKRKKARKAGEAGQTDTAAAVGFIRGHVFTERGIYRPGETVHFKGTVREYLDGKIAPPGQTTVQFKIVNSKNEEIYRKELALSEFGTASDSVTLKGYYPLGAYTLSMKFGENESETASRSFEVQEFRQPRHYVEIVYKRESRKDDAYVNLDMKKELLNCEINGKYYAGGPVKHGKVRWSIYHTKSDYARQDHPGYSFGHPLDARTDLIESGESMLDEKGRITVPVPIGKDILSGKYGIEVTASVVDFDGRASSDSSVYQADPDYLVGISNHPPLVQPGENQTLYAVVIDKKGSKVSKGSVLVQVMERGYTYIQKRNEEGYLYHEQQQVWRSQLSAELPIKDDKAVFDFDFTRGGEYLIAFTYRDGSGREYVSATKYSMPGYYYDYEYEGGRPQEAKNYGRLSLYPEKPLYTAGETIKVYINPPREASSYLITVEKDSLVEYGTLEVKPGQQYFELPVKDAYGPNVYISVLGTVARSSFPVYTAQFDKEAPTFLFGTVNVEVKGGQQKLKIAVNEEQKKLKSLPGAEMTLNIATTDQEGKGVISEMAVAVVDESILSMTGFETPSLDILGKFILPLGVFTGDLRLDLLKQTPYGFFRNAALTGGDGEEAGPEAVSSKVRKDFNPVAYFNPSVRTDANGKATVKFTFPDSMTTYRVYAVACDKGSRFGSYQRPALVVKDFYMEPGLPAFLTRGDRFRFAVSAFNKMDKSGDVDFSAKPDDLLTLAVQGKSFSLAGFDRTLIPVDATVKKAGTTTVQFSGKFKDLSDIVELKLPVNSGHVLGSDTVFGNFRKTTEVGYKLPQAVKELRWEDVGPGEVRCVLTVSGSPFLRMSQGLRYFLHYPYG